MAFLDNHDKFQNSRKLKKGATIFDKAFLSTTLARESVIGRDYANPKNTLLKIYVPKGTPCIYLDLIADMGENEILFAPMTKLKVLDASFFGRYIECIVEN